MSASKHYVPGCCLQTSWHRILLFWPVVSPHSVPGCRLFFCYTKWLWILVWAPADSCSSSAHYKCLHQIYHHQHTFSVYLPLHSELCLARKTRLHQTFNSPSLPTPVSWWYWVGCPCGKQRPLTRTPDTGLHRRSGAHRGRARSSGWKWNTCNGPCPGLRSASPPPQSLSARRASC